MPSCHMARNTTSQTAAKRSLPQRPRALLLDFDGVILQSVKIKDDAFAEVYRDESVHHVERVRAYQRQHGGISRRVKFDYFERQVFGRTPSESDLDELCTRFRQLALQSVLACPFVPGAREFLDATWHLTDLHVVSGSPHDELNYILERRNLGKYFKSVYGAPATKPEAFRDILTRFSYEPDRAIAIGDSVTEFHAARDCVVPFMGVIAPGQVNPFPSDVWVVPSLVGVNQMLGLQ